MIVGDLYCIKVERNRGVEPKDRVTLLYSHGTTVAVVSVVPSGHGLGSRCTLRSLAESVHRADLYYLSSGRCAL